MNTNITKPENSNFYTESKKKNSQCKFCGEKGETYQLWYKTGWSRGDDDYLGKICKKCKGKFNRNEIDFIWNKELNSWELKENNL